MNSNQKVYVTTKQIDWGGKIPANRVLKVTSDTNLSEQFPGKVKLWSNWPNQPRKLVDENKVKTRNRTED